MKNNDRVMCPLVYEEIENIDCIENSDAAEKIIIKETVPDKYKVLPNWEDVCKECRWHNY